MYITRQEAYIDLSELGAEGLHWSYVEQSMLAPWFYIALNRHSDGETSRTMLQTMDPSVLATVICNSSREFSVNDVMLATPPYINGTSSWLMEKLLEYSQCHNEQHGSLELYLVPGKHYHTPKFESDLENLKMEACIYYSSLNI